MMPLTKGTASLRDAEENYVHIINTKENDTVANALCMCQILNQKSCGDLKQHLTTYQMSCLIVQIVLHVTQSDFEKICDHIRNQEQLKHLKDLYFTYQSISEETFKQSAGDQDFTVGLNMQFIHLTNKIRACIKNPRLLLDHLEKVMVNESYAIQLFHKDSLKCFYGLDAAVLFQALSIFWTWSDHSVLRELLLSGKHTEALKFLDKFDRDLGSFKSTTIENLPFPRVTSQMVPMDNKHTHTILAIKYKKPYDDCTWKNITEVRSKLLTTFKVTRNALQFLGVLREDSKFMLIYWMIPRCVIPLITPTIADLKSTGGLYKLGVTEVSVYPNLHFSTGDSIRVGPLAVLMNSLAEETKELPDTIHSDTIHSDRNQIQLKNAATQTEELTTKTDPVSLQKEEYDYNEKEVDKSISKISIEVLKEELAEIQSHRDALNLNNQKLKKENGLLIQRYTEAKESLVHKLKVKAENDDLREQNQLLQKRLQSVEVEMEICNSQCLSAKRKCMKLQDITKLLYKALLKCKEMNCRAVRNFGRSAHYAKKMICSINKFVIVIYRIPYNIKKKYKSYHRAKTYARVNIYFAKRLIYRELSVIKTKITHFSRKCKFYRKNFIVSTNKCYSTVRKATSVATKALQSANQSLTPFEHEQRGTNDGDITPSEASSSSGPFSDSQGISSGLDNTDSSCDSSCNTCTSQELAEESGADEIVE